MCKFWLALKVTYLETKVKEFNLDLWLLVMLSTSDQKIYVGNSSVFHSFEMNEVDAACEFVKTLTETTCNEFIRNPESFKQLIEEPKVLRKWNFWSRRKKYREELFDDRFRHIS